MKQALLWMFLCLTLSGVLVGTNRTGATGRQPRQYGADVSSPRHILGIWTV